ncbi:hypothetical protein D0O09_05625 [Pseudomonas putida]|nr:hypothetical protein D0O09_05625 [Pseudomonas putida]
MLYGLWGAWSAPLFFAWRSCSACTGPFAGLPAPTGLRRSRELCSTCGSGQAREEAGTGQQKSPHQTMRALSFIAVRLRPPWLPAGSASGSAH